MLVFLVLMDILRFVFCYRYNFFYVNINFFQMMVFCDEFCIKKNECNKIEIGEYIVVVNVIDKVKFQIFMIVVDLLNLKFVKYQIKKIGYYCLFMSLFNVDEYKVVVEWWNVYGEFFVIQILKLLFYGGIMVVYVLLVCYWGFFYYQYCYDICGL